MGALKTSPKAPLVTIAETILVRSWRDQEEPVRYSMVRAIRRKKRRLNGAQGNGMYLPKPHLIQCKSSVVGCTLKRGSIIYETSQVNNVAALSDNREVEFIIRRVPDPRTISFYTYYPMSSRLLFRR